ncbi:class I SAM-dependent DNA methyltransferase [Campylobacter volucris]|uniref:site-specific DNA-methyltransferase (adenine-specific) n=1 Tax=Campylobacter volucris TaxID=1031542 RepID=A0A5C7DRP8_9BACT|nr:Eco57I restriction-modification methylase domain-containing protein [Campylobacter volucris]TXE89001.1 class I SAM-dependent DNA methyltransferase [Campylobacter volucris]
MHFNRLSPKEFIEKYSIKIPSKITIENFKTQISNFLSKALKQTQEEYQKNEISNFLKSVYHYDLNIKNKIDLAIYEDEKINVIFEVKSTINKTEFPKSSQNLLSKAFCESILYFLRERKILKNNSIKHIIICNACEYFIINAKEFEKLFTNDKTILTYFKNCEQKEGTSTKTKEFFDKTYDYLATLDSSINYTHFILKENLDEESLSYIYQILSPFTLLNQKQNYDANALNKKFYEELLYILGLEENDRKIILSKEPNTISHAIKESYPDISFDDIFALLIAWNNRILFLRLFESMLLSFNHIKKPFLDEEKIPNFAKLSELFFEVLAKKEDQRNISDFAFVPYLNSSLFDKTPQEAQGKEIKLLNSKPLKIFTNSILKKDPFYKDKNSLLLLEYLFAFLKAYDFTTTNKDIQANLKTNHDKLINSSVLGNVFEKLNGYKEGSFYTPSFITSYMCKESISKVVLDKFEKIYDFKAKSIQELRMLIDRNFSTQKQKEYLDTILSIKICDPAVGSGHFLVSALNELMLIVYELGLINALLRSKAKLENDEFIVFVNDKEIFHYQKPNFQNDPLHQIQQELFECKKLIIENCLFGVDINPNSCEITKLRLWIELLKYSFYIFENDTNTNSLQTLPNIDINIKCGNSLISYFNTNKDFTNYPNIKEGINHYKQVVKDYKEGFYEDKSKLAKQILHIKESFKNFCLKDTFAKEIKTLTNNANEYSKKYGDYLAQDESDLKFKSLFSKNIFELDFDKKQAQKEFNELKKTYDSIFNLESSKPFEWRFEFPEVLDESGNFKGFDLIIGNPPYIRQEEIKELKNTLNKNYKVYKGTADIYTYFYELGFNVLKENGILSFITSNKYTRAGYGEPLREFLLKNTCILKYIDLNGIKVFDSATVDTSILSFEKSKTKENTFKYLSLNNELLKDYDFEISAIKEFLNISQNSLSKESFTFNDESTNALKTKIEKFGTPLKDWHGLNINYGIKTGLNEAFIITTEKKDEILANCKDEDEKERTAKLIRKMLRGRDIKRYSYEWAGLWVIGTFPSLKIDIEQYPSLKSYLSNFLPRIEQSGEKGCRKKTSNKWFETQDNIAYYEEFEKEKIVYSEIVRKPQFYLDINLNFYAEATSFVLTGENLKYLIAFLNNDFVAFIFKSFYAGGNLGESGFRYKKAFLEKLPIPKINSKNEKLANELVSLVDEILKAKEQNKNANTQEQENKINSIVYKLYNLTEEEIKIIEGK